MQIRSTEKEKILSKYGVMELTPLNELGENIFYKRDDLYRPFGRDNVNGGKVRQGLSLVVENLENIRNTHNNTIITQSSVGSPQGAIVAIVAREFGLRCIVCVGGRLEQTLYKHPQMRLIKKFGGEIKIVAGHGMPGVLNARINEINKKENFFNIGYGINVESCYSSLIDTTANQVKNLPKELDYLVVPVGSGLQMAGMLKGVKDQNKKIGKIIGVQAGASRKRKIEELLRGLKIDYDLIAPIAPYEKLFKDENIINGGAHLDPLYEAKAHYWMRNEMISHYGEKRKHPKVCFWVIGHRLDG